MRENSQNPLHSSPLPGSLQMRINEICNLFEAKWKSNQIPTVSDYVPSGWTSEERGALLQELILVDLHYRRLANESPQMEDYLSCFSDFKEVIEIAFGWVEPSESLEAKEKSSNPSQFPRETQPGMNAVPTRIGEYRIEKELGRGSFGVVYKAWDESIARHVAIKIPNSGGIAAAGGIEM